MNSISLQAGYGVVGDIHAGAADKQLSLIDKATFANLPPDGLCPPRFQPNIEIESFGEWPPVRGARYKAGDAVIELEQVGKECWPECPALSRAGPCPLSINCVYARVIESGGVSVGQGLNKETLT